MKLPFIILCLLCFTVSADELRLTSGTGQKILIELYTSEGCSSCPPAEKYLNSFRDHKELWNTYIPVAFHVDYWDYIGWRDRFASPEFSQRQRQHAREKNVRTVYTPYFIVNGAAWRPGWFSNKPPNVKPSPAGELNVIINKDKLTADFKPISGGQNNLQLHIALLGLNLVSHVNAGENNDRTLKQEFVVIGFKSLRGNKGHWRTQLPSLHVNGSTPKAIAIWVTNNYSLKPLQAVGGYLSK